VLASELTEAVEESHPWTRGHARRVTTLALSVGESLGWDEGRLAAVRAGSMLHDVGKLLLPTELLGKAGPLTPQELGEVRTHPAAGARLIAGSSEATDALPCVLYHHERWDGLDEHRWQTSRRPHQTSRSRGLDGQSVGNAIDVTLRRFARR
jgi:HD-GYP domain-containing protein (c-di-GMP phosphodiesterase class II)